MPIQTVTMPVAIIRRIAAMARATALAAAARLA
jgi:hypothetical protein